MVGLPTIRTDVSTYPAERFVGKVDGVMGSPPCQSFSSAGKRAGLADPRGRMIYEPMRYVRAIRPRWVALEQVPEVIVYWRWIARELRGMGYSAWCGVLMAADYGVPQCRQRAILLASLDRRAEPPAPTHSKTGHADLLGESLLPWVSMAEALGWGATNRPANAIVAKRELAGGSHSRAALRAEQNGGSWRVRTGTNTGGAAGHPEEREPYECGIDRPSPTVLGNSVGRWKLLSPGRSYTSAPRIADPATDPAPTIALGHNASSWCWERPATTVMTDHRVFPPTGHHPGNGKDPKSWSSEAVPVEPWELGVLQGFPADHPWQPPHLARQIGNAFPPPFALACLRSLVGPV